MNAMPCEMFVGVTGTFIDEIAIDRKNDRKG